MPTPEGSAITFVINGPIARADLPGLYRRACAAMEHGDALVAFCEVRGVNPDAVAVDALARLQLAARRLGYSIGLRNPSAELCALPSSVPVRPVWRPSSPRRRLAMSKFSQVRSPSNLRVAPTSRLARCI